MNDYRIRTSILACCMLCCCIAIPAFACNQPPVPGINDNVTPYGQCVPCGQYITLDGSWSYDPDGWITSYWWDIRRWNGSYYESYDDVTSSSSSTSWSTSTPGKYRIDLWVYDNDGDWSWSCDNCYVWHVTVTLDCPDYVQLDDIQPIYLSVQPNMYFGEMVLSKSCSGDGDVEVYYDPDGTEPVTLPKEWDCWRNGFPGATLDVKGTDMSSTIDDVTLTLAYVYNSETVDSDSEAFTVSSFTEDPGDTYGEYTLIDITGGPIFEQIDPSGDVDWYKFEVDGAAYLDLDLSFAAGENLDWYLYAADDLATPILSGNSGSNPETGVANLTSGSYYLKIEGASGSTSIYEITPTAVIIDIDADSDRTGSIEGSWAEESLEDQQTAIVPVNCDDDDQFPDVDCANNCIDNQADLSDLVQLIVRAVPSGWTATLSIASGNPDRLRVFTGNDYWQSGDDDWYPGQPNPDYSYPILGAREGYSTVTSYPIPDPTVERTYYMEALAFRTTTADDWELELTVTNGPVTLSDKVHLRPSPFILLPASSTSSETYASSAFDPVNADITVPHDTTTQREYHEDPWLQDEFEIGYTKWPGGQMSVIWNLPRDRELNEWPDDPLIQPDYRLLGPGYGVVSPNNVGTTEEKGDYGGGIEATEPVTYGGAYRKCGIVVVGDNSSASLRNFIEAQGVQPVLWIGPIKPFLVPFPVSELRVTHIFCKPF